MNKSKHTEAQIIAALKQVEAGRTAEDVVRECSEQAHDLRLEGEVPTNN
jgi:putative transposase